MFPNYALNYPAPIHVYPRPAGGTISPSRQYPPPPVQIAPSSYWQSLYVQPDPRDFAQDPLATSSPPLRQFQQQPISPTHDYENMRPSQEAPLPLPRRRPAKSSMAHNRESTVIDGRVTSRRPGDPDQASLVSEVLDAEVTAITTNSSSSSPGSSGSRRKSESGGATPKRTSLNQSTSSSGIASKNNSQHLHTSSSSGGSQQQQFLSPDSKNPLEPIFETNQQPFYENWPPKQTQEPPPVRPKPTTSTNFHGVHYMQPLSIVAPAVPPLMPHGAKPSHSAHDTSLDTPTSARVGESRPGSSHSAPMLDVSIDRHYEFDTRTPTDELNLKGIREALPRQWNRPYLGYNPRQRDREMGAAAQLARSERVFSDSEIYSPVFPRGRPEVQTEDDVSARVLKMKKELQEYRELQIQQQAEEEPQAFSGQSSPKSVSKKSSRTGSSASKTSKDQGQDQRLESLI